MFNRTIQILTLILLFAAMGGNAEAARARIKKVLPQLIDLEGRNSVSPSLYERDAYQNLLRKTPEKCGGLRFQIQWVGQGADRLILRVEMRGVRDNVVHNKTVELPVKKIGWFSTWTEVELRGADYKDFGDLTAWRATLWNAGEQISEQQSFLWEQN